MQLALTFCAFYRYFIYRIYWVASDNFDWRNLMMVLMISMDIWHVMKKNSTVVGCVCVESTFPPKYVHASPWMQVQLPWKLWHNVQNRLSLWSNFLWQSELLNWVFCGSQNGYSSKLFIVHDAVASHLLPMHWMLCSFSGGESPHVQRIQALFLFIIIRNSVDDVVCRYSLCDHFKDEVLYNKALYKLTLLCFTSITFCFILVIIVDRDGSECQQLRLELLDVQTELMNTKQKVQVHRQSCYCQWWMNLCRDFTLTVW